MSEVERGIVDLLGKVKVLEAEVDKLIADKNEWKSQAMYHRMERGELIVENRKLRAERDNLRKALDEIQGMGFDMPMTLELTEEQWARRRASLMQQIARKALREKSE